MTQEELDKIIETDLFQMRGFAVRYIDYGKQLVTQPAINIFADLEAVDAEIKDLQMRVERTEKEAFEALKAGHPDQAELVQAFKNILDNVDKGHTDALLIKRAMIDGVKAKYGL